MSLFGKILIAVFVWMVIVIVAFPPGPVSLVIGMVGCTGIVFYLIVRGHPEPVESNEKFIARLQAGQWKRLVFLGLVYMAANVLNLITRWGEESVYLLVGAVVFFFVGVAMFRKEVAVEERGDGWRVGFPGWAG